MKYLWLTALLLGACDLSNKTADGRTETLAYVTETILKPSCGTAECHSAFKAERDDVFDSVAGFQASYDKHHDLVYTCAQIAPSFGEDVPTCEAHNDDAASSYLITVITVGENGPPFYRMPLDELMSNEDIVLLKNWIRDGAEGLQLAQ